MSNATQVVGPYERLMLLKEISLSGHPPVAALAALAQQADERQLAAGENLMEHDRPWEHAYAIVEGHVSLSQDGQLLYSAGPREVFGLLEILARVEGGFEARADVDTLVLQLRATTLLSVLQDHFVMSLDTIRALGRMMLSTPDWLTTNLGRRRFTVPEIMSSEGLDLVDRIRVLQATEIFVRSRVDSLAEVASQCEEFRAEAGTVLWQEDEESNWMAVLLDGRVESTSKNGLRFAWSPGTAPGVIETLAAARRWHDATAVTSVTGLRLSAERFLDALEDDFAMAADVLWALATRVRQQQTLGRSRPPAHDTQD